MPWCDECDRFMNPSTLDVEGRCPSCDEVVADRGAAQEAAEVKIPWHFWVGVVALSIYLGWRAIEAVLFLF